MPAVSVIMPSYNHAPYIGQAIESVLSQTLADLELIIIDDGSTDGTREILQRYSDPRLKVVLRERNVGAAQGSNDGLRMASAPFVAMISSDDFFAPHKLETQLRAIRADANVAAVFCRPRIVDHAGNEFPPGAHPWSGLFSSGRWARPQLLRRLFYEGNFLCHPSVLLRREIYDRAGDYDVRLSSLGDCDMWMRTAIAVDGDFVVLDAPLLSFRAHETNTSGPSAANVQCGENEWPLIVDRMRGLSASPEVFAAAFPAVAGLLFGAPADFDYALARLALTHGTRSVRGYGLRRLYEQMADPIAAVRLATVHGFTPRDLIGLSQRTDTTGVQVDASVNDVAVTTNVVANAGVDHDAVTPPLVAQRSSPPRHAMHRIAHEADRFARRVQRITSSTVARMRSAAGRTHAKPGYTAIIRDPMGCREAGIIASRYFDKRGLAGESRGLHLGSGNQYFEGWLNVDLGGRPDVAWDITRAFEWVPDAQFDICFSEHVLEHFVRPVGLTLLREVNRCLRPGGVLRIAIPDLANVVKMYADQPFLDIPHATRDVLEPTAVEATVLFGSSYGTKGERLNVCVYGWGRRYLYDEEDLTRVLAEAGFTNMRRCRHSESSHPGLRSLETRPTFQSALIVEGAKP